MAGVDTRLVWKDVYSLLLQGAASRTDTGARQVVAPLWQATFNRTGRRYGLRGQLRGHRPRLRAPQSGFINRGGIAHASLTNQLTSYGSPGGWLERFTSDVVVDGTWLYDEFVAGRASQDRKLHFNQNLALRGGWRLGGSVLVESFGYDESLYEDYAVAHPTPDGGLRFVPYTGDASAQPRLRGVLRGADAQGPDRRRPHPLGQGRELLRVVVGRHRLRQRRRHLAAHQPAAAGGRATSSSRSSAAPTAATSASGASRA